jgi:CHAP domain
MIFNRRVILGGILTVPALATNIHSAPITDLRIGTEGMEGFDSLPSEFKDGVFAHPNLSLKFGSNPPPPFYVALAAAILRNAPYDCRPIDVAYYFSNLRERKIAPNIMSELIDICTRFASPELANPAFLSIFAYDWERNGYFNPVVIGFFNGVGLKPYAGDLTPWCATFANWCISRSRASSANDVTFGNALRRMGTQDASSGSFRCWGTDSSSDPREGDIIVWARKGTERSKCPVRAQGHVAFVSRVERSSSGSVSYKVVGGNQGYRKGSGPTGGRDVAASDIAQAISYRSIGISFADRIFHSVRTLPFVR